MKKILVAATLFVLLISLSTGNEYETILVDDRLNERFHIEGYLISSSDNTTDVTLQYNLTLEKIDYNRTEINNFTVVLADGEKALISDSSDLGTLERGEWKYGFKSIESQKSPDRVDRVILIAEHQATIFDGDTVEETARNHLRRSLNPIHPEIRSLQTDVSEVRRGQNITVTAETSDISRLTTDQTNFSSTGEDSFRANLTVPRDTGENQHPLYTLVDGRGNSFQKSLDAKVVNTHPEIELEFNNSVEHGENTEIEIQTSDDYRINETYISFRGRDYTPESGQITLLTHRLEPGEYSFEAVTVDSEGEKTTEEGTLHVLGDSSETSGESRDSEDSNSSNDTENTPIIASLINFLKSLF